MCPSYCIAAKTMLGKYNICKTIINYRHRHRPHHHNCQIAIPTTLKNHNLVGGLEHFLFFHTLGFSSSQLTFIFFRGLGPPSSNNNNDHPWIFVSPKDGTLLGFLVKNNSHTVRICHDIVELIPVLSLHRQFNGLCIQ